MPSKEKEAGGGDASAAGDTAGHQAAVSLCGDVTGDSWGKGTAVVGCTLPVRDGAMVAGDQVAACGGEASAVGGGAAGIGDELADLEQSACSTLACLQTVAINGQITITKDLSQRI